MDVRRNDERRDVSGGGRRPARCRSAVLKDMPPYRPFAASPTSSVAMVPSLNALRALCGNAFVNWNPLSTGSKPGTLTLAMPPVPPLGTMDPWPGPEERPL